MSYSTGREGSTKLEASREEIEMFVQALWRYADEGTVVQFRAFDERGHGANSYPLNDRCVRINGAGLVPVIEKAFLGANEAANAPRPVAFCPPVATFRPHRYKADSEYLANGLTLSVECDQSPVAAKEKLERILGPATIVVESGGIWTSPEGEAQKKIHLHWRLNEPTRTPEEHGQLTTARKLACDLVNGDRTSINPVHPMRWPGSWHRKNEPKQCRILSFNDYREIDLAEAIVALKEVIAALPEGERKRIDDTIGGREARKDAELIAAISTGSEYHRPLCVLAMRYLNRGMQPNTVLSTLQGFMLAVPSAIRDRKPGTEIEPGRWKARYDDIPNLIESGRLEIEKIRAKEQARGGSNDNADAAAKPVIRLVDGELPRIVNEAEAALIEAGLDVYQRGGLIVRPVVAIVPAAGGRKVVSQRLLDLNEAALVEYLTIAADFERYDARSQKWRKVDCPSKVAATLLSRGQWRLRSLVGIVATPIMRPDGSILEQPGYDPETRLIFDPMGASFPPVPQAPSEKDAKAALLTLRGFVETFPFAASDEGEGGDKNSSDKKAVNEAVAISGILTAIMRRCLRTAPAHAVTACVAGSGKSKLVDVAAVIATGRPCPVLGQGGSAEEAEKRLASALIAGEALISIDNCEYPLSGELLCMALTQDVLSLRLLGQSKNVQVPAAAAIFATGNNLTIQGDVTRRALLCRLDPKVERPETRAFPFDPVDQALERRGEAVVAALTLLRAHFLAGRPRPKGMEPLGSFEEWSSVIRDAIVWAGGSDPTVSIADARASDPERAQLEAVLTAWSETPELTGEGAVTVKAIITEAMEIVEGGKLKREALHDALLQVAGVKGSLNSWRLGKWLTRVKGKIVGNRKILQGANRSGVATWALSVLNVPQNDRCAESSGFGGFNRSVLNLDGKLSEETNDSFYSGLETTPPNQPNPRTLKNGLHADGHDEDAALGIKGWEN